MLRIRSRQPRRPRVYRIPVETYLVALAVAFALSVAFSLLSVPKEIDYRLQLRFGVEDETFLPSTHALSNPTPIEGNRIRLLENGDAFFPAMLGAITRARSSINQRARAGVEVRILLDAIGSGAKLSRDDVSAMRAAGCAVEFFHPLRPWMLDTINHRTHCRLLVVDGKIGFTGGAGVADVWLGNAEKPGHWRDTQVEVAGPAVELLASGVKVSEYGPTMLHAKTMVVDGVFATIGRPTSITVPSA